MVTTAFFRSTQNALQTTIGPYGHEVLRLNPSIVGIAVTLIGVSATLAAFWLVRRSNNARIRAVTFVGIGLLGAAILIVMLGNSTVTYLFSAVFLGLSGGLVMPILVTVAGQVPGVSRGRALASYTVALSVSLAIGPVFESLVLGSTRGSLKIALLSFLPLLVIASLFVGFMAYPARTSLGSDHLVSSGPMISENLFLRTAAVAVILYQIPFTAITAFGALIALNTYHVSLSLMQVPFTVFFLVSFGARSALVWKPPARRSTVLLQVAAIVTLAGLVMIGFGHGYVFLLVAIGILGLPHGLIYPVSISLVSQGTDGASLAKANSILYGAMSTVSFIVPLLLGLVATYFGYRDMVLLVLVPVVILTWMLFKSNID